LFIILLMPENIPQINVDPVKEEPKKFNWKKVVFVVIGGAAIIFAGLSSYYYLQFNSLDTSPQLKPREASSSAQKNDNKKEEEGLVTVKEGLLPFTFGHPTNWHVYIDTTPNENKETHIWFDESPIFVSASGRPPGKILIRDLLILDQDSTLFGFKDVNGALTKAKKKYVSSKQETFTIDSATVYKLSGKQNLSEFVGGGSVDSFEYYIGFRSDSNPTVDHVVEFGVVTLSKDTPKKDFDTLEKIVKSLKFTRIIR